MRKSVILLIPVVVAVLAGGQPGMAEGPVSASRDAFGRDASTSARSGTGSSNAAGKSSADKPASGALDTPSADKPGGFSDAVRGTIGNRVADAKHWGAGGAAVGGMIGTLAGNPAKGAAIGFGVGATAGWIGGGIKETVDLIDGKSSKCELPPDSDKYSDLPDL